MFLTDILFAIFEFLPVDSLLLASLVSSTFLKAQRQAIQHRDGNALSARTLHFREVWMKAFSGVGLLRPAASFLRWIERSLQEFALETGSSNIALPGLSVSNPIEELPFIPGSHFTCVDQTVENVVHWRAQHRYPLIKVAGSVGRVDIAIGGGQGVSNVIGLCIVVINEMTGSLVRLSVAGRFDETVCRQIEWDIDVDPSCVSFLPSVSNNEGRHTADRILSSHPTAFTNLRRVRQPETVSSLPLPVIPLDLLLPIDLTAFLVEPNSSRNSINRLMKLCESAHNRDTFLQCVQDQFLNPLKRVANENNSFPTVQFEEVIEQLTTPKGVWSYPSGMAKCTVVDLPQLLERRSGLFLTQISRHWSRSLRDLLSWWAPLGILVTFS